MAVPVWMVLINEATGVTFADTAPGTAVSMTVTPGAGSAWGVNSGGVLYNFAATASAVNTSGPGALGKIATAFTGAQKLSVEWESNHNTLTSDSTAFYLGGQFGNWAIICSIGNLGVTVDIAAGDGEYTFATTVGRHRYQVVFDSTAAAGSRIQVWVDGVAATATVNGEVTANSAIDVNATGWGSDNEIQVGQYCGGNFFNGTISYVGLYAAPTLTTPIAVTHNTNIFNNNDANPNLGTAPSDAMFFGGGP